MMVSLAAAALVLHLRGAAFNSMVLAGLAVALGVVIDDAVSGTERVLRASTAAGAPDTPAVRRSSTPPSKSAAVLHALLFVLLPVVPVFFMGDLFGAFGRPLAISYAMALAASMVTALMLAPALSRCCSSGRRPPVRRSPRPQRATRSCSARVAAVTPSRRLTVRRPGAVGLALLPQLRRSALPELKERDFLVELEAAPGTSLPKMNEMTSDISRQLRAVPGVRGRHGTPAARSPATRSPTSTRPTCGSASTRRRYGKTVKAMKSRGRPERRARQ